MAKLLTGFVNLTKCKEAKLFKNKAGDVCCNIILWLNDDAPDKYGNTANIQLQVEKGAPKVYVGNLKPYEKKEASAPQQQQHPTDDLPF